ncbi:aspartate/glutamate racemase [Paucibacter sp. KBW04]|uniref:aspartate/glutamate racemase family protein n=1 Tax=Paucibacter sp. KBW04 TaxID=2153361 RepID=UPI000F5749BF|nr:aspartate/glutamate racemase family protein [Paucibacter sp. KBW04]RQO53713.1 aspartate/glutamate racemase [Paucibacter sp. KBW04]
MKTIGLIGGMSWESTLLYYQTLNREVSRRLGGLHSARILMHSLDFEEVVRGQKAGDWVSLTRLLRRAAQGLAGAGADCLLICTNTMHKIADEVAAEGLPPLLHIADVTGQAILGRGLRRVALLGTRYTMEQSFYMDRLARMGVECIVPPQAQRDEVHRIIFEELCLGDFREESRQTLQNIVADTALRGAEGVILGCTELPLILRATDLSLPLFDTTELHAMAAADFALADMPASLSTV